ncbi:GNAT family N-acetyltransferase [Hymenobacter chitinivorans]|uniref:RimJ/RimL family protein N-acetyltransferase n=1 Tax=Hymenobacter chitinivorans DSM 11115 TaxID=1121954 RepID=A0A2M9BL02_9BACT|nr:GNAT family N-acetyltransferase [Hymenobacter chitinivorans]PJJ58611.1 RimJ/RimL family protein N-acetyltransferase [Hymenobacter chitinivorans DSM 11115]
MLRWPFLSYLMPLNLQPRLENQQVLLLPLQADDFADLYAAASDPKIWEQHPNKDRWQREVFQTFFEGALQSQGAFKIVDKATGAVAGSTRFYGPDEQDASIHIGYTFYATRYWGTGLNLLVKGLMLDYIFQFVAQVYFHIGAVNRRSQIAIGRLGAEKIAEEEIAYFGEAPKLNFVYRLGKEEWLTRAQSGPAGR